MKKSFIIVAIAVLVLTFAGSAWAHGGNSTGRRSGGGHMAYCGSAQNQSFGHHMMRRTQPGMGFRNSSNRPFDQRDIPQDILNKRDEMRRTHLELRLELAQPQVNREKALSLHEKMLNLRQELSRWMFNQRLANGIRQ
ncbi:MAG: hypothetical protein PHE14_05850 [Aminobacterium colombiense]|jgi:hypothetical protein|uniref:hypothetical protein n=1 Tax=Aminobacterium TaxID=81466 RepID=UPI0016AC06BA|nr:hypothetical protein [Aminobacterium sp. EBM-42]MDD2379790.1 hypothetical protein [Aminobacterium colombiense]MDD3767736.1 hypothetical protein [Aminobacterium colombiense]MDD4265955.1 hypothetical protein [Aminobacterium colombiense]MDD4585159.1 hypothetical protein [Aminobacterium colombiense]NLK30547.1 hypothetical protein [Aminobacterium colombiense]